MSMGRPRGLVRAVGMSVLGLLFWVSSRPAAGMQHIVEMVTPRGGGRGETVEVLLHGLYLEDAQEIVFHSPGIRCVSIQGLEHVAGGEFAHGGKARKALRATLEISKDCPLGEHWLRLRTGRFLSEHVSFWVGPFPTVPEKETQRGGNDSATGAELIPLNSTVNGRILPGDDPDVDCYAVRLRKGQRFTAELESVRLGTLHFGGENDCVIRVFGPGGALAAKCDDTALWLQDPFVSFQAPETGLYVVEVSQQMHTPGNHCFYRLHAGTFRRPVAVYPPGGQAGTILDATVFDAGFEANPARESIVLPASASNEEMAFAPHYSSAGGVVAPSGLPMRVTTHANVIEDPTRTRSEEGQRVEFPAALNGIISADAGRDRWRFWARKGERWTIRVFARTLGSPLDPRLTVRRADSEAKPVLDADDATLPARGYWGFHTRLKPKDLLDPAEVFEAPQDGEYLLEVSDTRGMGSPWSVYRVEVDPHQDGLHPYVMGQFAFKNARSIAFVVPKGNRWTLPVLIGESVGTRFKGDLYLEASGLPTGVSMEGGIYTQGLRTVPVTFSADKDAKVGVYPIRLNARARDGHSLSGYCQQGVTLSDRRGGYAWHSGILKEFMLAVVDPVPFRLEPPSLRWSVARNGEITLSLRVEREPGFDEPLELQADWLPPGVEKGPPVRVEKGVMQADLQLRASDKAMLGDWPVTVTATTLDGSVSDGAGCRLVTTPLMVLSVAEPYLTARVQRVAIERGQRGRVEVELHENRRIPAVARAVLKHLPHGVVQVGGPVEIAPGADSCAFEVEVTRDALIGQYKEIFLEISIPEGTRTVRQQTGSGVLRVDPEKKR
jgi:hypothetical protein